MDEKNINENNVEENVNETVETTSTPEPEVEARPEAQAAPEPQVEPTPQPQVEQTVEQATQPQQSQPKTDGKATASMVCGIISVIPCCWGIVTLALGIIAVVLSSNYAKETGDAQNSKAKAGKICGIIGIVGSVIGMIYALIILANGGLDNLRFN